MKAKAIVAMAAALVLTGSMVREGRGTSVFDLHGETELTVSTASESGARYDSGSLDDHSKVLVDSGGVVVGSIVAHNSSKVSLLSDGVVGSIVAWDDSEVSLSGGEVGGLAARGDSIVNISGGVVNNDLAAFGDSTVSVTGGQVLGKIFTHDTCTVNISGGSVSYIDNSVSVKSTVKISGGHVGFYWAWAPVNISGGQVETLAADGTSVVTMSGGEVNWLYATGTNTVNMSGGQVDNLFAFDTSPLIFNADVLDLGDGLLRSGNQVWGSGVLTGEWYGGQTFSTIINGGASGAVPEPMTMLTAFLGMGSLGGYLRRRARRRTGSPGLDAV